MKAASIAALITALLVATGGAQNAEKGSAIFKANCRMCHDPASNTDGIGPGLKGLFKNEKLPASKRPATKENVRKQILGGGNGMPPFADRLSAAEVDDLIAYLETL
jgi:mono/diheme cytochrome c family protein